MADDVQHTQDQLSMERSTSTVIIDGCVGYRVLEIFGCQNISATRGNARWAAITYISDHGWRNQIFTISW